MSQYLKSSFNSGAYDSGMSVNNAGGFSFQITPWQRLSRFLIIGSEGGTYYTHESKLTAQNCVNLIDCIQKDGARVVTEIIEISKNGRAPKNDPALFALAACTVYGDLNTRKLAYDSLTTVARIGTDLFHFLAYQDALGKKWNRSRRNAVSNWYHSYTPKQLAYQLAKYKQRDGWSHKDALILAHPKPHDGLYSALFDYAVNGTNLWLNLPDGRVIINDDFRILWAMNRAFANENDWQYGVNLIADYGLTHEMVPASWKKHSEIWEALLVKMPLTALIRNLGNMSKVGLFGVGSNNTQIVVDKLNHEYIRKSRLHPINILSAMKTYSSGHGDKSDSTWMPNTQIVDALNEAFYMAFANCEPTNKSTIVAVDVSGSMVGLANGTNLTSAECAAAIAMQIARTESDYIVFGFAGTFLDLKIRPNMKLNEVLSITNIWNFGSTDCTVPLRWAMRNNYKAENFVIITDSETWQNRTTVHGELENYRSKMRLSAKMAVLGTVSNEFSIANPNDAGQMDFVGFDSATPSVMFDFLRSNYGLL